MLAGNQAEQTIAVNPTDTRNIVVLANTAAGLLRGLTFNGGRPWKHRTLTDACCDPSLAFDGYGNLFMSYLYSSFPDAVPVKLSVDGGKTFTLIGNAGGAGSLPAVPHATRGGGFADQPSIVAGGGVVWVTYTAGDSHVVAAGAPVRPGSGRWARCSRARRSQASTASATTATSPSGRTGRSW